MLSGLLARVLDIGLVQLVAIWSVVVFAAIMRAFTGFGFALTAVPVISLFMLPTQAVVLSVMLTLAVSLLTLPTFWGKFPVRTLWPLIVSAALGTVLGTVLLANVPSSVFQLGIGVSVIGASLALTFYRPAQKEAGPGLTATTGFASGLMNGAFAIPGPPVIIYAMATQPEPDRSRALLMTFFLFSAIAAVLSYCVAGFVQVDSLWLFLLVFPAMYVGDKLGYYLFHRYGTGLYRRVALGVLFLVGGTIAARAFF